MLISSLNNKELNTSVLLIYHYTGQHALVLNTDHSIM